MTFIYLFIVLYLQHLISYVAACLELGSDRCSRVAPSRVGQSHLEFCFVQKSCSTPGLGQRLTAVPAREAA